MVVAAGVSHLCKQQNGGGGAVRDQRAVMVVADATALWKLCSSVRPHSAVLLAIFGCCRVASCVTPRCSLVAATAPLHRPPRLSSCSSLPTIPDYFQMLCL